MPSEKQTSTARNGTSTDERNPCTKATAGSKSAEGDTLCDVESVRILCIARLVEFCRFTIPETRSDERVSYRRLAEYFSPLGVDAVQLQRLWAKLTGIGTSQPDAEILQTFGELLDFQFQAFPEIASDDLENLKAMASDRTADFISRKEVTANLHESTQEDIAETVNFIFAAGVNPLPIEVFKDIVDSLSLRPMVDSLPLDFTGDMVNAGKDMYGFWFYTVVLIMALALLPQLWGRDNFTLYHNMMHFIEGDWAAGCPNGTTSSFGCNFVQKNIHLVKTAEFDALRFVRSELIYRLWPSPGESAAAKPLGSVALVGSLLIRLTPDANTANASRISGTCQMNNLSSKYADPSLPGLFDCGHYWHIAIPFNATREEALAAASAADIVDSPEKMALISQFAAYQPSTGLTAYTQIVITLPAGGSATSRVRINVVNFGAQWFVLPLMIAELLLFLLKLGQAIVYRIKFPQMGILNLDLLTEFVAFVVISIVFAQFRGLPLSEAVWWQVDHIPKDFDSLAFSYRNAKVILAFWCLFYVFLMVKYFSRISGVQLFTRVLKRALTEIFGMCVVFLIWFIFFLYAAVVLFGDTMSQYCSLYNASRTLWLYFYELNDYGELQAEHPTLGPIFFLVWSVFVTFFALNLLVAVLTTPLENVEEESDLNEQVIERCLHSIESNPEHKALEHLQFKAYSALLPWVNVMIDATPSPSKRLMWLSLRAAIHVMYHPDHCADGCAQYFMDGLEAFIDIVVVPDVELDDWDTLLLRTSAKYIDPDDWRAWNVVLLCIKRVEPTAVERDARLLRALIDYDFFSTHRQRVGDLLETLRAEWAAKHEDTPVVFLDGTDEIPDEDIEDSRAAPVQVDQLPSFPALHTETNDGEPSPDPTEASMHKTPKLSESVSAVFENKIEAVEADFNITNHAARELYLNRGLVVFIVVFAAIYLWFFVPLATMEQPTGYLVRNLHFGIRDFPIMEECYDEACESGFTFRKTFMDTGDVAEWYVWMRKVFMRQVFPRDGVHTFGADYDPNQVYWDRRTRLIGPVRIRQMRAKQTSCNFSPLPSNFPTVETLEDEWRIGSLRKQFECFSLSKGGYATDPIPFPNQAPSPPTGVSATAYQHTDICPEVQVMQTDFRGHFANYPCSGYVAEVSNATGLEALLASKWIDGVTRLVAVTATFTTGSFDVEYTLITELCDDGGCASNWMRSGTHLDSEIYTKFVVALCLTSLPVLLFLGRYAYYFYRYLQGDPERTIEILRPEIPISTFVAYCCLLLALAAQRDLAIRIQIIILGALITFTTLKSVVVPIVLLFDPNVSTLLGTLFFSMKSMLLFIPYMACFTIGFTYCGMLIFSDTFGDFSSFSFGIQSIFFGHFVGLEYQEMEDDHPSMGPLFNFLFICMLFVLVNNFILALVESASKRSHEHPKEVVLARVLCEKYEEKVHNFYTPIGGDLFLFILHWSRSSTVRHWIRSHLEDWLFQNSFFTARSTLPSICTGKGRVLFPSEALLYVLEPLRCNEMLRMIHHRTLNRLAYSSAILYVVSYAIGFAKDSVSLELADTKLEQDRSQKRSAQLYRRYSSRDTKSVGKFA